MSNLTIKQEIEIQEKVIEVITELYKNIHIDSKNNSASDIENIINCASYDFRDTVKSEYTKLNNLIKKENELNGKE